MNYFSALFLGVFLPLTIIIYNLVPQKHRWKVLLASSYIFFWSISGKLLIYLIITTLIMYIFGQAFNYLQNKKKAKLKEIDKEKKKEVKAYFNKRQKIFCVLAIIALLAMLIILKYSAFLTTNINSLMHTLNIEYQFDIPHLVMPIGISFYTLEAIAYIYDVYKGKIVADKNLPKIALFIGFFPKLMEGPISRYSQIADSLWKCEKVTYERLTFGLQRVLWGLMKKIVIADRLNSFVANVFNNYSYYDGGVVALGMILYTIQLYMDFSGTIDVVIGIGEIFGVKLPENFRQPFFSKTTSEFWKRWHITLGAWFRDYIFYPVSLTNKCKKFTSFSRKKWGNYYGPLISSSIALFLVWLCNGIWHGSAWNYIFFGLYYFVLIMTGRFFEPIIEKITTKLHIDRKSFYYKVLQIIKTTCFVLVGELFFRANGFLAGLEMFKKMISEFSLESIFNKTILGFGMGRYDFLIVITMLVVVFIISILKEKGINIREALSKKNIIFRWSIFYALILIIIVFGAYGDGYVPVDPMYAEF